MAWTDFLFRRDPNVAAHAAAPGVAAHKDFSDKTRKKLAGTGAAMPDGSYPIQNESDLKNAIKAYGRAKDPAAVKKHIISRAKSLGLSKLIPDNWKGSTSESERSSRTRLLGSADASPSVTRERATHAITLPVSADGKPPEWIEAIPAGTFSGVDGRGPYHNSNPQGVVDATKKVMAGQMKAGLPVDLDHAGALGGQLGLPAPAVGWIHDLEVRNGAIFARVEWTDEGAQAIESKKYKYISPVIDIDKPEGTPDDVSTGIVLQLMSIALTNNPNLALPPLTNSRSTRNATMAFTANEYRLIAIHAKKGKSLSETVQALQDALPMVHPHKILDMAKMAVDPEAMDAADGDPATMDAADGDPDGDGDDDGYDAESRHDPFEKPEEMAARHMSEMAACATDEEKSACAARHNEEKKKFAASAAHRARPARQERQMTDAEFRARMARDPMVLGLNKAINDMRRESSTEKATKVVEAAISAGKLIPAQREWAVAYCTSDLKGFETFVGKQPALAVATDGSVLGVRLPALAADDPASLTEDELAVCEETATDPKKFLAQRNSNLALMRAKPAAGAIIKVEMGGPKTVIAAA